MAGFALLYGAIAGKLAYYGIKAEPEDTGSIGAARQQLSISRPDLVDLTQAKSQVPHDVIALSDFATVIWDIAEITSTGATGDSTKATQEKGEKMLRCVTDYLVGLVEELERRGWKYDLKK